MDTFHTRRRMPRWLVLLGVAFTLLVCAAPAMGQVTPGYPLHRDCGPANDGEVIWFAERFWTCKDTVNGWRWYPAPQVPYARGSKDNLNGGTLQMCQGCYYGRWEVFTPRDWVRDTHVKVDYADFQSSIQTVPAGDGAWMSIFEHWYGPAPQYAHVLTITILDGAHAGRTSYTTWVDP